MSCAARKKEESRDLYVLLLFETLMSNSVDHFFGAKPNPGEKCFARPEKDCLPLIEAAIEAHGADAVQAWKAQDKHKHRLLHLYLLRLYIWLHTHTAHS